MIQLEDLINRFIKNELEIGVSFSSNANNENVIVTVNDSSLDIAICQKNNWIRHNVYYRDGSREDSIGVIRWFKCGYFVSRLMLYCQFN